MLLGASGSKAGLTVDLEVATDPTKTGDAGVPHGNELLAFATAANRRSDVLPQARAALAAVVGHEGLVEATATVAIFNGLVRVADGKIVPGCSFNIFPQRNAIKVMLQLLHRQCSCL